LEPSGDPSRLSLHQRIDVRRSSGTRSPTGSPTRWSTPISRASVCARGLRDHGHHQPIILPARSAVPPAWSRRWRAEVRAAVKGLGYEQEGFHWRSTADYKCYLHAQSRTSPWASRARRQQGRGRRAVAGHHVRATPPTRRRSSCRRPCNTPRSSQHLKDLARTRPLRRVARTGARRQEPGEPWPNENGKPVRAASIVLFDPA